MQLLFDCEFDESIDDYSETYKVYVLPDISDDGLRGSWEHLSEKSTQFLGLLPVRGVVFDPSMRREVETQIIDALLGHAPSSVAVAGLNADGTPDTGKFYHGYSDSTGK
jgi:hypothetical protein